MADLTGSLLAVFRNSVLHFVLDTMELLLAFGSLRQLNLPSLPLLRWDQHLGLFSIGLSAVSFVYEEDVSQS